MVAWLTCKDVDLGSTPGDSNIFLTLTCMAQVYSIPSLTNLCSTHMEQVDCCNYCWDMSGRWNNGDRLNLDCQDRKHLKVHSYPKWKCSITEVNRKNSYNKSYTIQRPSTYAVLIHWAIQYFHQLTVCGQLKSGK